MELTGLKDGSFQVRLREAFPLVERFEVPYVVVDEPEKAEVEVQGQSKEGFTLLNKEDNNKVNVIRFITLLSAIGNWKGLWQGAGFQ